jgi:hypothetical protein
LRAQGRSGRRRRLKAQRANGSRRSPGLTPARLLVPFAAQVKLKPRCDRPQFP